jgi:hypothetical protein
MSDLTRPACMYASRVCEASCMYMCVGRVVEGAHQGFAGMGVGVSIEGMGVSVEGMGVSVEGVGSREGRERGC